MKIKTTGTIVKATGAIIEVRLDTSSAIVQAYVRGKMRRSNIKVVERDRVEVEIDPLNPKLVIIVKRLNNSTVESV